MSARSAGPIGLARMVGRDPDEHHRVASPLELFFDLVFVVAVSQAAQNLHHGVSEGHSAASLALTIPVATFMTVVWALLLRATTPWVSSMIYLALAVAVLLSALLPEATVIGTTLGVVLAVAIVERGRIVRARDSAVS